MDMLLLGDLEMGEPEIIFGERRQVLMAAISNIRRKNVVHQEICEDDRVLLSLFYDMIILNLYLDNFWLAMAYG